MELKENLLDGLRRRRQYIKKQYKESDKFIALFEVDTLIKVVEKYSKGPEKEHHVKRRRKEKEEKEVKSYKRKVKVKGLFY